MCVVVIWRITISFFMVNGVGLAMFCYMIDRD